MQLDDGVVQALVKDENLVLHMVRYSHKTRAMQVVERLDEL